MKSEAIIHIHHSNADISYLQQCLIAISVLIIVCLGQLIIPLWAIVVGPIGVLIGYLILRNDLYTLICYIGMIIAVKLRVREVEISPIDIVAGMLMTSILVSFIIKKSLFPRRTLVPHPLHYLVLLFAFWTVGIALISFIEDKTTFNSLYREFLTFSPLIFIPILFNAIVKKNEYDLKYLVRFLFLLWVVEEIASVLYIRQSMHAAVFLFQTGKVAYDVAGNSVMIFTLLSLSTIESQKKYRKYYIIGILISTLGLLLSMNRTAWLLTLGLAPFLLLLTPRSQRKNRNRIVIETLLITLGCATLLYFAVPLFQLLMKWFYLKFLTSSNLRTDVSLVNRYIEWRYVIQQILSTPIGGIGFGGQYKLYGWIGGYTIDSYYTHNGFLGILLKSGIVGFILIFTVHIKFFIMGVKLSVERILNDKEKALVRTGLFVIILITFHMFTMNPFMQREILWYLGLVWSYFIYLEHKVNTYPSELQKTNG